jgi:hypothetical protein
MSKRKRFNPLEETSITTDISSTSPSVVAGETLTVEEKVERIERLKPSQMIPDRFQPRRLLPSGIRRRFFSGEITCYQAAREWLDLASDDSGWKKRVGELLDMGGSFKDQGQIKPITGTWITTETGDFVFQIETGERRFWAACLLAVQGDTADELELRVEVVERPTRHRQVLENRHTQSPSAVGQACEIASLMLEASGVQPDPGMEDEFEYFRLAVKQRAPRGMWPKLEPVMQYSTRRMQQLLAVLQLPARLLEYADRHRVPERHLREVLLLPKSKWKTALEAAVRQEMTSEDVASLATKPERSRTDDARRAPERIAFTGMRRFARAVLNVDSDERVWVLDGVADEIVVQGFADALLPLLRGLEERIAVRLKGNTG